MRAYANPSPLHEYSVDNLAKQGFAVGNFAFFCRLLWLQSGLPEKPVCLESVFDQIKNSKGKQFNRSKYFERIRKYYDDFYSGADGVECFNDEMVELKDLLKFVPDAWRYNPKNKTLDCLEVVDTNPMTWPKLKKYAFLDDSIFERCEGYRVLLAEIDCKRKSIVDHFFNWIFDHDIECENLAKLRCEDKLRLYYKEALPFAEKEGLIEKMDFWLRSNRAMDQFVT